jgi:Holliday junction resolvase RusA-like endonuclease
MSVRKRTKGDYAAWIVDFVDIGRKRRHKTFATQKEADRFQAMVKAIGSGLMPEELISGYKPIEFNVPALTKLKGQSSRTAIAEALHAVYPTLTPTTENVIVHIIAEMPPSHVIADVDNILKPVLDALKGIAWMDDTQVYELLIRRVLAQKRRLRIKIWCVPGSTLLPFLNTMATLTLPTNIF